MKQQLDDAQKMASDVGQHLAEARNLMASYRRSHAEAGYRNLTDMVLEASKTGERLTEKLRRLSLEVVVDTMKYEQYQSELVMIHGIEIQYREGILEITAPVLIPHRKESYTDYLYKPLQTAFWNWCMKRREDGQEIPEFGQCTVCFLHLYDRALPIGRVRDHDNVEEKHVLDVISNFFLVSDGGLYTDTYHFTRLGEEDATRIFIMDAERFPRWVSAF
ncbi:DUF6100 family protein [Lachnospiraceae bacterium 29-91]